MKLDRSRYSDFNFNEYVYACPTSRTGLRWAVNRFAVLEDGTLGRQVTAIGDVAGSDSGRYWRVVIDGVKYAAHRIVYALTNGELDGKLDIDHRDGNGHNNLPCNLRAVTKAVNARNSKKKTGKRAGVSGITGVSLFAPIGRKPYWRAAILPLDGSGKKISKMFSISALGNDEALRLAKEWRDNGVAQLNRDGAGYSERHGI